MCESCNGDGFGRREFLALGGAMGASMFLSGLASDRAGWLTGAALAVDGSTLRGI